uniref:mitogen-activated protein kinase kinase kinase n=1 Tax=Kalanchoe fedtschenkoi TaxID=63787 RepID=A0A7N0UEK6_KALFE
MPWWSPAVILSSSLPDDTATTTATDNNDNCSDGQGQSDLSARRLERQRKLRHLREADIAGLDRLVAVSAPDSGSPDPDMPRLSPFDHFHNSNNNNASSPPGSNSNSRSSSVQPQPLPLPELSALLRRDGYAASSRLPSPKEPPNRFAESGRYADFKIGGLNQSTSHRMERNTKRPSRKAPQNLKFVDVESNKFSLPCRSAPSSPYASPCLSPQRRSTGEMFTSYYTSTAPQKNQIWSAPEMPFSDGYTGFPSPASPEQSKCSPDSCLTRGSYNHHCSNTRSTQHDPRNSSRAASPLTKKATGDASTSPQSSSYTNVHPLPLPPGASSPSSTGAPLPAPSSILPTPSAPLPAPLAVLPASAPPVPQVPIRPEFSSANNWQKGKLIGRGTFGSVYVATNLQTGALCAMKEVELIHDDPKSAECMKQLEQEIKLLSRLKHPNIVQYYGSQIVDDKLYIFLEYVHPGAISLSYLHSKKTVHRDIKGANLLVDSAGVVKLADFGMAKHLTGEAANLSLKGSPYWMAPELMQSVMQKDMKPDLACAVDIWSLGCTIIEMLNGKPPWSEYEGAAAMFKVMRESPRIPDTLSHEGKEFLQCCFRRNPADRPTANALLEHPFLRNSHQDVQSCTNGLNGMKIKDRGFSSEGASIYNHDRLLGVSSRAQTKPLKPPESFMSSSFYPVRLATSSALT